MSQVGRKAGPGPPGPARRPSGPGTFVDVAGFRIGRGGRDNRTPQGQQAPQGPPHGHGHGRGHGPAQPGGPSYGQQPYGRPGPSGPSYGYPSAPQPPYQRQAQPYGYPGAADDGPEYFGDGAHPGHGPAAHDPYAANNPGHTQAFSVDEAAGYTQGATYQAGSAAAPAAPLGPPLHWKELLKGIVLSPNDTFLRMRDYTMWTPALVVTFLYGLLAVFGFDGARQDAISATLSNAVPIVLITAVVMVLGLFVLGVVTHTLARQLGGDGAWQPTVGLSMLITALTDAPRLIVAMFFGGDAGFVQLLGWATWIGAGALLTLMVSRSHDLPWPRALGASAIQLIALLSIVKLGTF
ncbi:MULTISPECIES: Yip1 family protein [Streptomyces]|uniref:YIP1 family protein n=1 Tax=Streptomyces flaveolus TaxID=67297 RepID=A0ABV3A728_9ACTN|nr:MULTISPECIES: Yip1 family protein [Streptomyces]KOV90643.1 membrane protein [Streptomyces sp. NRRL WC-3723]MBG7701568.1 YIP1 family protein [Streptomyces sp. MC1]